MSKYKLTNDGTGIYEGEGLVYEDLTSVTMSVRKRMVDLLNQGKGVQGWGDLFGCLIADRCIDMSDGFILALEDVTPVACPLCAQKPYINKGGSFSCPAIVSCPVCDIEVDSEKGSRQDYDHPVRDLLKLMAITRWNIVCGNDERREEARTIYDRLLKAYSESDDRASGDKNG